MGATNDVSDAELYVLNISSPSSITLQGSAHSDDASLFALALRGSTLYAATGEDVSELRVGSVASPSAPQLPSGSGYNLTDVLDGQAIGLAGTGVVLGRANGAAIDELVLFSVASAAVPTTPGPWYLDAGGTVYGIDVEPGGHYAFAATGNGSKQFTVLSLWGWPNGSPEAASLSTATGDGRGLAYDAWKDRVYLVTNSAFLVFRPS